MAQKNSRRPNQEMQPNQELSVGESAIYDRQIRLWGSNAQMRIKAAKVLFIGLSRTTVEIAKNIVLAGSSVVLVDERAVDENSTNFLITLEVGDPSSMSPYSFHRLSYMYY